MRTTTESLTSIVLGLESFLVFFVMLTVFGLKALPAAVAFGGGLALIAVLLVASGLMRYRWGVWLGSALQLVLIGTGVLIPAMYVIGLGFAGLWAFCVGRGRQIDRDRADYRRAHPQNPTEDDIRPQSEEPI